jgi:hypothetical protein
MPPLPRKRPFRFRGRRGFEAHPAKPVDFVRLQRVIHELLAEARD